MASPTPHDAQPAAADEGAHDLGGTIERQREDLEVAHVLLGLSARLAEVRSTQETLEQAVDIARHLLEADRCFGVVWDPAERRFSLKAHSGFDAPGLELLQEVAGSAEGLPLMQLTLTQKAPFLAADPAAEGVSGLEQLARRGVGAYIGIPLIRRGEELGALGIEFGEPRRLGAREDALARGIGRQISAALSTARRFGLLQSLRSFGLRVGPKLHLQDVVDEVTGSAAALLGCDGAALYFLDEAGGLLTAVGAAGSLALPEGLTRFDPRAGDWGPLVGGKTVMVTDLSAQRSKDGLSTVLASPILGPGLELTGAVVVFFVDPPSLGADEVEALSVLAAQAGAAVDNARKFDNQRRVARSLQQGLLSTEAPSTDALEFGTVYAPAGGQADVGGDFFDVFELPGDRLGVVVGDVSGKGAEAAAQTAMAKYMLRAFATRNPAPSSVLYHLNNALVQGFEEDRFLTVVYGVFTADGLDATLAAGGHPNPLVYRARSGAIESFELEGTIVGAFAGEQFEQESLTLEPGDVVVAFSDGLLDVRSGSEFLGRQGIRESLARHAGAGAQKLADAIFKDAQEFGTVGDDTIVFTLARKETGDEES